ncbi:MAG: GDSL-type esterase/lipase family protein [Acidobacteriota bacterium]
MASPFVSRLWLWRLPALVAAAATLLFAGGFSLALRGTLGRPIGAAPPPPSAAAALVKPPGRRLLLVLGDSLARGTGDETGRGFAADVLDALRKRGPADVANLSVNGAESSELVELVRSANVRSLAASADVILVSIGGNDLSHAVARGPEAAGARIVEDITASRDRYLANLREILGALRSANSTAPILLLGLYDPFGDAGPGGRLGSSVILRWNGLLQETALGYPRTSVVQSFDLFERRPDRLGVDRFHPNRRGYEAIGSRMVQLLPEGS